MGDSDANKLFCRICLCNTGPFEEIFKSIKLKESQDKIHISEMICSFTNIQITVGDGLPENICTSCIQEVVKMYIFKQKCEETDKYLRKKLLSPTEDNSNTSNKVCVKLENSDYPTILYNQQNTNEGMGSHIFSDFENDIDLNVSDDLSESSSISRENKIEVKMKEYKEIGRSITESGNETDKIEIDGTFSVEEGPNTVILKTEDCTKLLKCNLCCHVFVNEEHLEKHLTKHLEVLQNEKESKLVDSSLENLCDLCNSIFVNRNSFEKHLKGHLQFKKDKEKNYFMCKKCKKPVRDLDCFKRHIKNYHCKKLRYSCPHCFMKYPQKGHFKNHLKYHNQETNIKGQPEDSENNCSHCNERFNTTTELSCNDTDVFMNKTISSRKKPHICQICLKAFNQASNLKDHIRTHNGEKPFLCATCGKGFSQLGNLRQHQVRHSGVKSHLCSTCGNGFASKGELHAHLRKHTGAKPFVCDTCGNGFTTSSSLTKHKRIHSGEKPYECDHCGMKFSRSGILLRHKRIHTGEKPYVCHFCKKAFRQSNDLNCHLRIHTGEKPYICDECDQPFRQNSALRSHKKTHLGKKGVQPSTQYNQIIEKKEDKVFVQEQEQIFLIP